MPSGLVCTMRSLFTFVSREAVKRELRVYGAGRTALVRACAQALGRHPLCRTHVVWVDCRDVETETLAKAKACLLPMVRPLLDPVVKTTQSKFKQTPTGTSHSSRYGVPHTGKY